jgi:hypothetical protein
MRDLKRSYNIHPKMLRDDISLTWSPPLSLTLSRRPQRNFHGLRTGISCTVVLAQRERSPHKLISPHSRGYRLNHPGKPLFSGRGYNRPRGSLFWHTLTTILRASCTCLRPRHGTVVSSCHRRRKLFAYWLDIISFPWHSYPCRTNTG